MLTSSLNKAIFGVVLSWLVQTAHAVTVPEALLPILRCTEQSADIDHEYLVLRATQRVLIIRTQQLQTAKPSEQALDAWIDHMRRLEAFNAEVDLHNQYIDVHHEQCYNQFFKSANVREVCSRIPSRSTDWCKDNAPNVVLPKD